jgi:hypothetical protein
MTTPIKLAPPPLSPEVEAFLSHFVSATQENPIGHGRIYGGALIELCSVHGGRVWLKSVWAMEKRMGYGTRAMEFIANLSDTYGVEIAITPKKFGREGMTTAQLRKWYRRFGFLPNGAGWMRREPKAPGKD